MKIGIITLYYNSINYGGNLQAYALCKFLEKNHLKVEQIPYKSSLEEKKSLLEKLKVNSPVSLVKKLVNKVCLLPHKDEYVRIIQARREAFFTFNSEVIPHADTVYTKDTIGQAVEKYDVFITGSDQVWNMNWYDSAYFLDFVPSSKKKLSYAASISMDQLSEEQKCVMRKNLEGFAAVSVREKKAVELLESLSTVKPIQVLDPTLLLDKQDWEMVCQDRIVEEKYIFCYFLGANIGAKKIAEEYAKKMGMKLVAIPYSSGNFQLENVKYGDIRLEAVSPEGFLSLIKYSEYVFTDSFHAVVFSFIFQKQFFVFNRDSKGSMNSRITTLTEMLEVTERFCVGQDKEEIKYVTLLKDIDYDKLFVKLEECKKTSIAFLRDNVLNIDN